MAVIKNASDHVGEDVEKSEPFFTVCGNTNWYSHMEVSMELPQIELSYYPAILLLPCLKEMRLVSWRDMHPHVHCSITQYIQGSETN